MKILIIGGGVMGLSIGWQLARAGFKVDIFERATSGAEASWVAAGMLAPYSEYGFEESPLLQLAEESLSLYPQFLNELNEDAKTDLTLEKAGTLYVGVNRDDHAFLECLFNTLKSKNLSASWICGKQAREMEPLLSPRITSAIWLPSETHIQNRKLLPALKKAFLKCGGILHEECSVTGLWKEGEELKGIRTQERVAGERVINTAGAWADAIREEIAPIYPNKGQILTLFMEKTFELKSVIRTPRVYLVPKSDGSLRVGATSEERGFDKRVTGGGILELLQAAFEVVPGIAYMEFLEAQANLRPTSLDRLPSIEETTLKGYFRAVGHGRAGILLAPYTAYEIVRKICRST